MEFFTITSFVLILVCVTYLLECARQSFERYQSETKNFSWGRYKFKISESTNKVVQFKGPFQSIKYKNPSTEPIFIDPGKTNLYECTPSELKECKISDATSCMGCKNMTARCIHLQDDTLYTDDKGKELKLPKSKTADDGYCLSVKKVTSLCNPHHGRLALVLYNREQDDEAYKEPEDSKSVFYNLLCVCTEPGYVGNLKLLGACEDPFVCNGKVKNINVPLSEMECDCGKGFEFRRINGLPTCQLCTVGGISPESEITIEESVPTTVYDKTIAGNYNGLSLPNPCRYCPITGRVSNGYIITGTDGSKQCRTSSPTFGIPIRRFKDTRLLAGEEGPDAVLAISNFTIDLYGYMDDITYPTLGVNFKRKDNEEFFKALKLDKDAYTLMLGPRHQVKFPGNFTMTFIDKVPNLKLFPGTFSYDFKLHNPVAYTDGIIKYLDPYLFNFSFDFLSIYYLWGRDSYNTVMNMKPFIVLNKVNGLSVYSTNKHLMEITDDSKRLRFMFMRFDLMERTIVMMTAKDLLDWNDYRELLIKEGDCGRLIKGVCVDPF